MHIKYNNNNNNKTQQILRTIWIFHMTTWRDNLQALQMDQRLEPNPVPVPGPTNGQRFFREWQEDAHSEDEKNTLPTIGGSDILANFNSDRDESIQESESE